MPNTNDQDTETGIFVDFTGDELIAIGKSCNALNLTFNEFIATAIQEAITKYTPTP